MAVRGQTRERILACAAQMIAERGYHGVSTDELGRAVGISGPGLYKHFPTKESLLGELLVGVSRRLVAGGRERARTQAPVPQRLSALVEFHVAFALDDAALIVIQDRDWRHLREEDRRAVRRLQRSYVAEWTAVLAPLRPDLAAEQARAAVQAVFGLMNSTPHSQGTLPRPEMADLLRDLALAALLRGRSTELP